jgi:hypothetical protein
MEYYSTIKKNEIMSFAGKWIELEITLIKISQTQKDNTTCFLSHAEFIFFKTIKVRWGLRGRRPREGGTKERNEDCI